MQEQLARKERVLDVEVSTATLGPILEGLRCAMRGEDGPRRVACANAYSVVLARRNAEVARALRAFDVVLPDGIGVVLASRLGGGRIKGKIGGPDLFHAVTVMADGLGDCRYFFLGSTPETLARIAARLGDRYPRIILAGALSPPFRPLSDGESLAIVRQVNDAQPTVLWVGMTAPKQELWVSRYGARIHAPVIGCVGAAFDYFAGTKRRPAWLARWGLLWAYRLASEPVRLWRRYLVSGPLFLYWLAKEIRAGHRS